MPDPWEVIKKQNDIIIKLLGRMAFTKEQIQEIVTHKKRNPENYVKGYNAYDDEKGVKEIAKIIGVKAGKLSPILQDWEEQGIVYKVEN